MRSRPAADPPIVCHPTRFTVGAHSVVCTQLAPSGRWTVSVDGTTTDATFETEVDAWSEGVRTADRLDRPAR